MSALSTTSSNYFIKELVVWIQSGNIHYSLHNNIYLEKKALSVSLLNSEIKGRRFSKILISFIQYKHGSL